MKRILFFFCLGFELSAGIALAQDDSPLQKKKDLYPSSSLGFGCLFPVFKNGVTATPWTGVNWRSSHFHAYYYSGSVQYPSDLNNQYNYYNPSSKVVYNQAYGESFGVGAHIPFIKLGISGSQKRIFLFNPVLDLDMGKMNVNRSDGTSSGSFNRTLSFSAVPGAEFNFPYFTVYGGLNITYNAFWGKSADYDILASGLSPADMVGYGGMKGLLVYPSLRIELHSLSGLLHPYSVQVGEREYAGSNYSGKVTESVDVQYKGSGWYQFDKYTKYSGGTWVSYDNWYAVYSKLESSYLGPALGVSFQRPFESRAQSFFTNFGLVFRKGMLATDLTMSVGKLGMDCPNWPLYTRNYYQGNAFSGLLALDIKNILLACFRGSTFKRTSNQGEKHLIARFKPLGDCNYFRILMGERFSLLSFHPVFADGNSTPPYPISTYYPASPDIYHVNTARNFYMALELGTFSFSFDFLADKKYPYSGGTLYGVAWHIPLKKWSEQSD